MSISFKHFIHLVEMSDAEFEQLNEISLSDIPGFGWLKGPDTAAKKQKIAQARKMLQGQKDAKSQERAKALDAALANMAAGNKPKKPGEIEDADWDQALGADDRKFNAKMDRMRSMKESRLNEGYAIKLKSGSWYSEQGFSGGPRPEGNLQVRVFKSMAAADDFLIKQQSTKYGGRKFEDAEIERYRPKK